MEPSESNAFARTLSSSRPPSRFGRRARMAFGVTLSLLLAGLVTLTFFLVGALVLRGLRHGDLRAGGAALAVLAITGLMARRGRSRHRE